TLISALSIGIGLYGQIDREQLKVELEKSSFMEQFDVANDLMYDKVYAEALFVWDFILKEHPTNANVLYKIGMCHVYLNNEAQALPYFEKAQYSVSKNYNPISPLEENAPPELFYYLAKSSHINGQVDTALYQYNFFLENVKKKHEKYALGVLGKTQCKVAQDMMANPTPYIIRNIGSAVNTAAPEYSPVVTIDGSALFFTSKRLRSDS